MNRDPLILFSTQAWSDLWVSKHWIAHEISKERPVLFVEPPARISFGSIKKTLKDSEAELKCISNNLYVLKTETLPFPFRVPSLVRPIWRIFLHQQVKSAIERLGFRKFYILNFDPHSFPLIKSLGEKVIRNVYYAVDPPLGNEDFIWSESRVVRDSDSVIAVTDRLANLLYKESGRDDIYVIPHGIDFKSSRDISGCRDKLPDCFNNLSEGSPVIGYTGAIHDVYVDLHLIKEAAKARPEYQFVFVGPYSGSSLSRKGIDPSFLLGVNNIHFAGSMPFHDLKCAIKKFDVCIVPYRVDIDNKWERRSPFKVLHYFSQGKPVVISDVPAAKDYGDLVYVYKSADDFLKIIDGLVNGVLDSDLSSVKRIGFAKERDFSNLMKKIRSLLFY